MELQPNASVLSRGFDWKPYLTLLYCQRFKSEVRRQNAIFFNDQRKDNQVNALLLSIFIFIYVKLYLLVV